MTNQSVGHLMTHRVVIHTRVPDDEFAAHNTKSACGITGSDKSHTEHWEVEKLASLAHLLLEYARGALYLQEEIPVSMGTPAVV